MVEAFNGTKLAIVGGVSTGKTTLLNEYQRKRQGDPRFSFVEEAARRFFSEQTQVRRRNPEEQSMDNARRIQSLVLESEMQAHNTGTEFIICDSSILTAGMYMIGHGEIKKAEELFKSVEFWLPTYNRFLLLNPEDVPYRNDNLRNEGEAHRARTHQAYLEYFSEKDIPYKLISGTVLERIKEIDKVLQLKD